MIISHNQAHNNAIITRLRHRQSLRDAHDALSAGLAHDFYQAPELAAEDFRQVATALGRITGDVDVEELLGRFFQAFVLENSRKRVIRVPVRRHILIGKMQNEQSL